MMIKASACLSCGAQQGLADPTKRRKRPTIDVLTSLTEPAPFCLRVAVARGASTGPGCRVDQLEEQVERPIVRYRGSFCEA
jgi:hypothetical protein